MRLSQSFSSLRIESLVLSNRELYQLEKIIIDYLSMFRFSASQIAKIKFEIYTKRHLLKKDFGEAEKTVNDLLSDYNQDMGGRYYHSRRHPIPMVTYSGS